MYDAFKQLFPTITLYSGWRIRDYPSVNTLRQVFSNALSLIGSGQLDSSDALSASVSVWVYQESLKYPDGPPYSSWVEFYGPVQEHGDSYSYVASWLFSNETADVEYIGIAVSGYGNRTNLPPQPFASENTTLVSHHH